MIRCHATSLKLCALLVTLVVLLQGGMAFANPWPREKGQGFLALASFDGAPSLWVDYGLGAGRTLALTAYLGRSDDFRIGLRVIQSRDARPGVLRHGLYSIMEWRRTPLGDGAMTGFGASLGADLIRPWPGWASMELQAGLLHGAAAQSGRVEWTAQGTLGLRPQERLTVMAQLQGEWTRAQSSLYLAPSVLWGATEQFSLELGLRRQIRGGLDQQIKLGTWLNF